MTFMDGAEPGSGYFLLYHFLETSDALIFLRLDIAFVHGPTISLIGKNL